MSGFLIAVILSAMFWLAVLIYALRRVFNNMKNNPEAQTAITRHVMTPLFGDKELPMAEEEKS